MSVYKNMNLGFVIKNFIAKYNTKGNMKLLADSFQRGFVIKHFIEWFNKFKFAFITPIIIEPSSVTASVSESVSESESSEKEKNILPTIEEVNSV
jgi:hypothetical protein